MLYFEQITVFMYKSVKLHNGIGYTQADSCVSFDMTCFGPAGPHWLNNREVSISPPVLVRLVLLASVGVSKGLFLESVGSESMCGNCNRCWWAEKIPFCWTPPPAIILSLAGVYTAIPHQKWLEEP